MKMVMSHEDGHLVEMSKRVIILIHLSWCVVVSVVVVEDKAVVKVQLKGKEMKVICIFWTFFWLLPPKISEFQKRGLCGTCAYQYQCFMQHLMAGSGQIIKGLRLRKKKCVRIRCQNSSPENRDGETVSMHHKRQEGNDAIKIVQSGNRTQVVATTMRYTNHCTN
jgi:hypothetical protein